MNSLLTNITWIWIGLILLIGFIFLITLIDIIRDKNWIWLLIVLIAPGLGLILYWLFGNIRS